MTISDANRVKIVYKKETAIGTEATDSFSAGFGPYEYRIVGESLNASRSFVTSDELRSDRMTADTVATEETNEGDLNIEWSFDTHDDFMTSALQEAWSTPLTFSQVADVDASSVDDSINSTGSNFSTTDISVGQWIRVAGFVANPTNNGVFRVLTVTTSKIVFDRKVGNTDPALITEAAAGLTITLEGKYISNGTTKAGFTVEKQFQDVTEYETFLGMEVNTMSLDAAVGSILTGTMGLMGRSSSNDSSATFTTEQAATSTDVLNAVNNLGHVFYGGGSYDDGFQSMSFEINNNLRPQRQIGSFALAGVGSGRLSITGSASAYFTDGADSDLIESNFTNSTGAELELVFQDNATEASANLIIFNFPNVKLTAQQKVAGGIDTDVLMEFEWEAVRDATSSTMVRISSVPV